MKVMRTLATLIYNGPYRLLGYGETKILFIVCHARSGSTLLNHLLISNSNIISNGERVYNYSSERDMDLFIMSARIRRNSFFRKYFYAVDQLTASERLANMKLLNSNRVRILFLIREPVAALSSMLKLAQSQKLSWDITDATKYYIDRLSMISEYGSILNDKTRGLFITYNDLIENTVTTLSRLQQFLNLRDPLSENYPLHSFTGVLGDPSETIQKGFIVRNPSIATIDCTPQMLTQLKHSYNSCEQKLSEFK